MQNLGFTSAAKCAIAALAFAGFSAAQAAMITIDLDTYNSGQNGGSVSLATLTLTQNGANVDFRIDNTIANHSGFTSGSFLTQVWFSFDGSPVLTNASFSNFGGQAYESLDLSAGNNAGYNFGSGFRLDYETANNSDRFRNGEFTTFTIAGVSLSDFDDLVAGPAGPALAMAHVNGLVNGGSTKYVGDATPPSNNVPEPGALLLLGAALAAAGASSRRKH